MQQDSTTTSTGRRYFRRRARRGAELDEISRDQALGLLGQGRKPGPAAYRRLEALDAGETIDAKWACGFELTSEAVAS